MSDARTPRPKIPWRIGQARMAVKHALRRRDGSGCCFCRRFLKFSQATFEHVLPRAFGGRNTLSNLRLSCSQCNRERGVRPFGEFLAERRRNQRLQTTSPLLKPNPQLQAP